MHKILVTICITAVTFFGATSFASVSDDQVTSRKIMEADGTTGQDTNTGSGVKTGHIQDGAVTPGKIGFLKNVVIVAPSGGNFTSPVDAVNAIADASASNPYLIKIMPGIYNIGSSSVIMKQYVDIEGSGESITEISGSISGVQGLITGASNAELRLLTIKNTGSGTVSGIFNSSAALKITHVTVNVSALDASDIIGVVNYNSPSVMTDVVINVAGHSSGGSARGVYNNNSSATIRDVNISITAGRVCYGIMNSGSSPTMEDVTINVSGQYSHGIVSQANSSLKITSSTITVTGSTSGHGVQSNVESGNVIDLTDSRISASGGSDTYGVYSDSLGTGMVKIDNSVIKSSGGTIYNSFTTTYVGNSKLEGGAITNISGTVKCIGVHDANYDPVVCP